MEGVILAGGVGRRLSPLTDGRPKYLVSVGGRPLIWYPAYSFIHTGVERIVIPVYYEFKDDLRDVLYSYFGDSIQIDLIEVDDYKAGNGYSLLTCIPYLRGDEFLLTMSDHIFDPKVPGVLVNFEGDCVIGADSYPIHISISEATKIYSPNNVDVLDIGKGIKYFNYIDMGIFKFRVPPLRRLYELDYDKKYTVSMIVRWLIDNGYVVRLADLSGYYWIDIDTIDEYWDVEKGILSLLPKYIVASTLSEAG